MYITLFLFSVVLFLLYFIYIFICIYANVYLYIYANMSGSELERKKKELVKILKKSGLSITVSRRSWHPF